MLIFLIFILVACGPVNTFSERKATEAVGSESRVEVPPHDSKSEDLSNEPVTDPAEISIEDPIEEEIPAQIPIVISGAYLACTSIVREKDVILSCSISSENKDEFSTASAGKILKTMADSKHYEFLVYDFQATDTQVVLLMSISRQSVIDLLQIKAAQQSPHVNLELKEITDAAGELPGSDTPAMQDLIKNGSFEADVIEDRSSEKSGFEKGFTDWQRTIGKSLEIHRGFSDWQAAAGEQWVELCSDGDSGIKQTFDSRPGSIYHISFKFSPHPGTKKYYNNLHVKVDGKEIFHTLKDGSDLEEPKWDTYEIEFIATKGSTELEFRSSGCTDKYGNVKSSKGTLLDDIKQIPKKGSR